MFDFKTMVILGGVTVFLIMLAVIIVLIVRKNLKNRNHPEYGYDERQKAIQGVAYEIAFFVLVGYNFVNGFICMFTKLWADVFIMNFVGICFALVVFVGYSVWKDAYITMSSKLSIWSVFFFVIGLLNTVMYFVCGVDETNEDFSSFINLIIGITFFIISIICFAKMFYDKVMEKKEIEE